MGNSAAFFYSRITWGPLSRSNARIYSVGHSRPARVLKFETPRRLRLGMPPFDFAMNGPGGFWFGVRFICGLPREQTSDLCHAQEAIVNEEQPEQHADYSANFSADTVKVLCSGQRNTFLGECLSTETKNKRRKNPT